jgi:hypothetical protein
VVRRIALAFFPIVVLAGFLALAGGLLVALLAAAVAPVAALAVAHALASFLIGSRVTTLIQTGQCTQNRAEIGRWPAS